ncbi:hypothetical protein [Sinisalibacter lacisalsi]|uniref:Tetratricopeptide repeat-like domain-containing protein n=1 Tax=Sinisalibacter lacisalsi TaxID=1526570 RepID=A0ABQ1QJ31_9RHOB|nr:hypothetical protein [Sinisalibacter lacisalsi]GGD29487.1 hypothetical protein GCM10011358_11890 [Sinisalibacter lacisalsi]
MSNPESFIDEVTEEVRRDKLYGQLKKYGWIGVVAVLLLVGGATVNEWIKARDRAEAEATGDAILAAVELDDAAARLATLDGIDAEGDRAALIALIAAAVAEDPQEADRRLRTLAEDAGQPALYRDLAQLKRALLPGALDAEARVEVLTPLTAPGGAFRVLAEEQIALAEIELGRTDAARTRLEALLNDTEASQPLRRRVSQLIVALGGTAPGAAL